MASRAAHVFFWLCLAVTFVTLRFDNSDRLYFLGDDNLVAFLVEDINTSGHWQPDWYRARAGLKIDAYFEQENTRTDLPHDHHYNFTAQILSGAALLKTARALGSDVHVPALLHHLAFFWETVSLLCVIGAARHLGGAPLARVAALLYTVFPLAVQGSHYARPDALLTAMGSAILWLSLLHDRMKPTAWIAANAGVLAFAIVGKASQLMLGIFPALAFMHMLVSTAPGSNRLSRVLIQGTALAFSIGALVSITFALADIRWHDFILSTQQIMLYYNNPSPPDGLAHYSWFAQCANILHYFHATLGAPWLLAMAIGTVSLWSKHRFAAAVLALPIFLFTVYFASVPAFFDRSFTSSSSAFVLLAAAGIGHLTAHITRPRRSAILTLLVAMAFSYQPILISADLYTDHLGKHRSEQRLAFQKTLKSEWPGFWLKNVARSDIFGRALPEKPPNNPRIYVVEDFNDWNSTQYVQQLRDNGFVAVTVFTGDFAHVPTSSLHTVHEAARYHYLVRRDEWPASKAIPTPQPAAQ